MEVPEKKDQDGERGDKDSLLFSKGMHGSDTEAELVSSIPIHASSVNERMDNVVSGSSMSGQIKKEVSTPRDFKTQVGSNRLPGE